MDISNLSCMSGGLNNNLRGCILHLPKSSNIMKLSKSTRTLFSLAALFFTALVCYGQDSSSNPLAGTWIKKMNGRTVTFTISSDLTYEVEFAGDDRADVVGSCEISGTQVTFNDEGGEYGADVPGVYEFEAGDTSLMLKKVNDPVGGRSMLVEGNWARATDQEK